MKNVSQPVLIIGKLLIEDRDRFKFIDGVTFDDSVIIVSDIKNKKQFRVTIGDRPYVWDQPWMTREECEYLGEVVAKIYLDEQDRKVKIEKERQRAEWLGAYSEDL